MTGVGDATVQARVSRRVPLLSRIGPVGIIHVTVNAGVGLPILCPAIAELAIAHFAIAEVAVMHLGVVVTPVASRGVGVAHVRMSVVLTSIVPCVMARVGSGVGPCIDAHPVDAREAVVAVRIPQARARFAVDQRAAREAQRKYSTYNSTLRDPHGYPPGRAPAK